MPTIGRRTRSLTAAASTRRITRGDWQRSDSPDARALFDLYRRCGAVWFGINVKANAAGKIDYFIARKPDPRAQPEPVEGGVFDEAYTRIQGVQGEFPEFVGQLCRQLDIAGEGYLVGEQEDGNETWAVWSPVEWDERRPARRHPDEAGNIDDALMSLRIWRPDPMRRHLPDSPLRSVAQQVEQYILFEDMITATSYSRIPAGLLLIPDEILTSYKVPGATTESIPFLEDLQQSLVAAVTDTQSASRVAPFYVHGPGDRLDQIRVVDMIRDLPEKAAELMERTLRQIAAGLDLPAEILLGMGDINHWGQWLIDDSARLNHVDPLVLLILDSLSRGYLHPFLDEAGVPNPTEYLFWRDYSDLTSRTLTIDEAIALLDRGVISQEAMRRIADLADDDAGTGVPLGTVEAVDVEDDRDIPDTLVASAVAESLADIDFRLFYRITEAAQAAVDRAVEKAGAKVRSHLHNNRSAPVELRALVKDVGNERVGLTLGREVVETLQLSEDELIPDGTFGPAADRIARMLEQGQNETAAAVQRITGQEPKRDLEEERTWRDTAKEWLIAALTALALSRFFTVPATPDPAETGEVGDADVPASDIWATLTIAGGGFPTDAPDRPRGLANGAQAEQWISDAGAQVTGYVWAVGAPAQPFEPHQSLSGVRFETFEDPALANRGTWPATSFFYPGDHRGCQCTRVLVIEPPSST